MKQDEIIEMARVWLSEFGIQELRRGADVEIEIGELEAFAKLVAVKEREACAELCERDAAAWGYDSNGASCAIAIRARGEA